MSDIKKDGSQSAWVVVQKGAVIPAAPSRPNLASTEQRGAVIPPAPQKPAVPSGQTQQSSSDGKDK